MTQFGLNAKTLAMIIGVLDRYPEIEAARIYGSRALGTYKPGSDIDICLDGAALDTKKLLGIANDFHELPTPYTIDVCIRHQIANENLLEHINRAGKLLYEKPSAAVGDTPRQGVPTRHANHS